VTQRITAAEYRAAPARRKPRTVKRDYKQEFLNQLKLYGLPLPTYGQGCELPELTFAPPRRWRFDWAYRQERIAIEYQGGNYTGRGGHNTVKGLRNDYEKFTEAALRDWLLILIDSGSVRDGRAMQWVARALNARREGPPLGEGVE